MEAFSSVSGISPPTVSKYVNDPGSVRPSTRQRIEEALRKFNNRPNCFAINQNRKSTRNIGIVVPRIEARCIGEGYWAITFCCHREPELEVIALDCFVP